MKRISAYITIMLLTFSCKEEKEIKPVSISEKAVYVLNEGNFRTGNASITQYNPENGEVSQSVYQNNNNGLLLGDVAQSMVSYNGRAYVVVNNSQKIEVLNLNNFQRLGAITGLNSPRYILPLANGKAYVSELYADVLYIVDLESYQITGSIATGGWTEEMVWYQNKAFVAHLDSNQIWVIDSRSDSLLFKIKTIGTPNSIELDGQNQIWVSCSGGANETGLQVFDPNTFQEIKRINYSSSLNNLSIDKQNAFLYCTSGSLYKMSLSDTLFPSNPLVDGTGKIFYSTAVDPSNGDVYFADAIDYQQAGLIYRYNAAGQLLAEFRAGIIPGYLFFKP